MRDFKIVKATSVHRLDVTSPTTGDISILDVYINSDNALHASVMMETSNASASVEIAVALFDKNDGLMGITDKSIVISEDSWVTDSGKYVCPILVFDLMGAFRYKVLVKSISAGSVDIYSLPLQMDDGTFITP